MNAHRGRLFQAKGAAGVKALWWAELGTGRNGRGAGLGERREAWGAAGGGQVSWDPEAT